MPIIMVFGKQVSIFLNIFRNEFLVLKLISGDSIIDLQRESKQWNFPQDVELIVQFRAEEGQCVAHVEIKIDQSSVDHDATIIGGGIGRDHIRILVKSKNTYWFKYEARVYGRNILEDY